MPAKPQWFLRLPDILQELRTLECPLVDRATIERVFRVRRRSALYLMQSFEGFQAGRTALVPRDAVIRTVEGLMGGDSFRQEKRQRARLWQDLDGVRLQLAARAVRISPPAIPPAIDSLPRGVAIDTGVLSVRFETVEDLLGKLFALSQVIATDYEAFEKMVSDRGLPE